MADKFKKHPGRETAGSGRAAGRHIGETGRVPDRFRDDDIRHLNSGGSGASSGGGGADMIASITFVAFLGALAGTFGRRQS